MPARVPFPLRPAHTAALFFFALLLATTLCAPPATRAAEGDCPNQYGGLGEAVNAEARPGELASLESALREAGLEAGGGTRAAAKLAKIQRAFADSWESPQKLQQLTLYRGKVYDSRAFQKAALELASGKKRTAELAFLDVQDGKWLAHATGGGTILRADLKAGGAKAILHPLSYQQVQDLPAAKLRSLVADAVLPDCPFAPEGKSKAVRLAALDNCVLNAYTTSRFFMNKQLWTGRYAQLSGEEWAFVRALDAALAKLPAEEAQTVYRGTKAHLLPIPTRKGELLELKGFTSTSPNKESAKGFLSGEDDLLMVIHAKSTRRISELSGAAGEDELLLPRGTWVRFDKVETRKIKVFNEGTGEKEERLVKFLHLTEVPAPAAPQR